MTSFKWSSQTVKSLGALLSSRHPQPKHQHVIWWCGTDTTRETRTCIRVYYINIFICIPFSPNQKVLINTFFQISHLNCTTPVGHRILWAGWSSLAFILHSVQKCISYSRWFQMNLHHQHFLLCAVDSVESWALPNIIKGAQTGPCL